MKIVCFLILTTLDKHKIQIDETPPKQCYIKEHMTIKYHTNLTRDQLEKNVKIIKKIQCPKRLVVYEALSILNENLALNIHFYFYLLVLSSHLLLLILVS